VRRSSLPGLVLFAVFASSMLAQSTPTRRLNSIPQEIEAHPEGLDPQWAVELDSIVQSATIVEIQQTLPALVALTESPQAQLRTSAILALYAIAGRNKAGLPENRRERDSQADETLVPYISRLEPRLTDPAAPARALALMLFQAMTAIRPTPPELIQAAIAILKDPHSTQPMPDTTHKFASGETHSIGPAILWVLLPAAADFYRDPATNITEGRDSPEAQEAIIAFLRRSDQTTESLSESIRALALAQPQNPAVNAALLPLLNSPDVEVRKALLRNIARLTLSQEDFALARTRVIALQTDPNTLAELKRITDSLLPCWSNNRHHGVCPPL
jgi:hypothetical protein